MHQGDFIKSILKKKKITQAQLAKLIGVSRVHVVKMLKNIVLTDDTEGSRKKILTALNLGEDDLEQPTKEEILNYLMKSELKNVNNINDPSIIDALNKSKTRIQEATKGFGNATAVSEAYHPYNQETPFHEISPGRYRMLIPLVDEYAQAGYLTDFSDPVYLEELPRHEITVDKYHRGRYMAFDVFGDSMDDDSKRSIPHGSIVTGREIRRELWKSKFHTHKFPYYIFITKTQGIIVKEIAEQDVQKGNLILRSLNPDKVKYPDISLHLDDVYQIFNIVKKEESY